MKRVLLFRCWKKQQLLHFMQIRTQIGFTQASRRSLLRWMCLCATIITIRDRKTEWKKTKRIEAVAGAAVAVAAKRYTMQSSFGLSIYKHWFKHGICFSVTRQFFSTLSLFLVLLFAMPCSDLCTVWVAMMTAFALRRRHKNLALIQR